MAQGSKKRLVLQRDWDIPIRPYVSKSDSGRYFAGREKELVFLANEIIRKKNGSILVCGHRGVGKTSLVYKAILKLKEKFPDAIVVVVNFSQLEITNPGEFEQKKVLESLIKRLYYTIERVEHAELEPGIKKEIEELYEKAIACKYKRYESNNQGHITSKITKKETSIYLDKVNLIYFIFWILAIIFGILSSAFPGIYLMKIIPFLLFPIPFAITLSYKANLSHAEKEYSENEAKKEQQFDNSVGNLESDLERLYRKMADETRVVYVIDELDKQEPELVNELFNKFKNLFTLSEAQFIFISGQDTYGKVNKNIDGEYRSKEYTYFTSKYFLSRPLLSDLLEYFDNITYSNVQIKEKDLATLKRALIFEATSDFFDLKNCVRNRMTSFDELDRPIIELNDLAYEDIQKARFQILISNLFEEKYMSTNPLKWSENELLQREIYNHAYKIYNSHLLTEFEDPYDDSLKSELIRDFNSLLERCGAFSTLPPQPINNGNYTKYVKKYKYEGSIPKEPPISLSYFTEYEKRFMNSFERYCNYVISLINAFEVMSNQEELDEKLCFKQLNLIPRRIRKFSITEFNEFPQYLKIYNNGIEKNNLEMYHREEIEKMTTNMKLAIEALFTKIPKSLVYILQKEYDLGNKMYNSKFVKYLYGELNKDPIYNSIIQELNNFSYIELPNDMEIFIGIDKKNMLKNFIDPANDRFNENEILIAEINLNNGLFSKNLKIIETDSPKNLKETLANFLENIKEYMNNFIITN
ncbi:MAG: ATP-binding protein [Methanosarcina sp.]